MTATKAQKLAIRRNSGFNEYVKSELVQWVKKDDAKTSLNELTFEEANLILMKQGDKIHAAEKWANFNKNNAKHLLILSLLYQAQWVCNYQGKEVPDLDRLSKWLQTKSPVKKPLNKMNENEIEKVIYAVTNIVKSIWEKK